MRFIAFRSMINGSLVDEKLLIGTVPTARAFRFAINDETTAVSEECRVKRPEVERFTLHSALFTQSLPPHGCRIFRLTAEKRLPRIRYEAETAYLSAYQELSNPLAVGSAYYAEDSLCSGGMKVTNLGNKPTNDLQWRDVWCQQSDRYRIVIKCPAFPDHSALTVSVNGRKGRRITARQAVDGRATLKLRLRKGLNTIRLYNDRGPMPDIDYMEIRK